MNKRTLKKNEINTNNKKKREKFGSAPQKTEEIASKDLRKSEGEEKKKAITEILQVKQKKSKRKKYKLICLV